jgi:phenylacetate-CoA ligase
MFRMKRFLRGRPSAGHPRGIHWPSFPDLGEGAAAVLLYELDRVERLPVQEVEALQLEQLHALLTHVWRAVPWYAARLREAGFDPSIPLTPAVWERLPILDRRTLQREAENLRSRPPPDHGPETYATTSGSTGVPIVVYRSRLSQVVTNTVALRDHLWHERDVDGCRTSIRLVRGGVAEYPQGDSARGWAPIPFARRTRGTQRRLNVLTDVNLQLEWLGRNPPSYLVTYPSNLAELLRLMRAGGVSFPGLREITTVSEVVTPELRRECLEVLGVPIADIYATMELGILALQCPTGDHYHVQSETVRVEVLDEDGSPTPPGGVGRVVATALHEYAMPLLRYEVGDMAEVGSDCACGRTLPVLRRILGRYRNMVTFPDGRRHWPLLGEHRFPEIARITQYQLVQHAVDDLELRAVATAPVTQAEEDRIREGLREKLGHPFPLRFTYVSHIPRSDGGKFEDFVSLVKPEASP